MGVSLKNECIGFTCSQDSYTSLHKYPRSTDPVSGISTAIVGVGSTTVSFQVGLSPVNRRYDHKFAGAAFLPTSFKVKHTMDDDFSGWVLGKLQILDDFSDDFDGARTVFTLSEDGAAISFEKDIGVPVIIQNSLLIFLDDVLQEPGKAYTYSGGTQIAFTEPPKKGAKLQILFYRGTDTDVGTLTATPSLKTGDIIEINSNPEAGQDERIVRNISSRDTIQTTLYRGPGISSSKTPLRPISWSKQRNDKFVDGVVVSKARDLYVGQVYPAARIIQDIAKNATTFYTDAGIIGFKRTEAPDAADMELKIIDTDKDNTGFGSVGFNYPKTVITGATCTGDDGILTGIGVHSGYITFEFHIPLNSPHRVTEYGGKTQSTITNGDYFIISNSNVGEGVEARNSSGSATVGVGTEFCDGVYQCHSVTGIGQTLRVRTRYTGSHGIAVGLGSGQGYNYGNYSWTKWTCSAIGAAYTCNTSNGLTGLSTAPQIQRSTKLSLDYT